MSHFAPMQPLQDLAAQLREGDEWGDERSVVDAVCIELQAEHPPFLTEATGEWREPYLNLEFTHDDGTIVKVSHGDGYTAVGGGSMSYRSYLDTTCLIDVLIGALRGRMTYVHHSRFGYRVGDYFEIVGREGQPCGYSRRGLDAVPFLLRSIPLIPESVHRTRVTFVGTPAVVGG